MRPRCYACDTPMNGESNRFAVMTEDGQVQFVGPDCYERTREASDIGYQPPKGGPRLFTRSNCPHKL